MLGIIVVASISFFLYFLVCNLYGSNHKYKKHFLVAFIVSTFLLRYFIDPKCSNDYYLYYHFKIFSKPTSVLSFILNEPYLYGVYWFFSLFSTDKVIVFDNIYWLNHLITISFFVWLLLRTDVAPWKKIILFALFYPVLDFALLRNAPVYELFALYFYYSFRNKKFKGVLVTPFIHVSSLLLFPILLHRFKHYYTYLVIFLTTPIVFYFILLPYLNNIDAFQRLIVKINAYSNMGNLNEKMHTAFLVTILLTTVFFAFIYKRRLTNPILVSTFLLYFCSFFFNVSVAYRLALYYIFALFLFGSVKDENILLTKWMNVLSIIMYPVYMYSLYLSHKPFFSSC